jgi:hypothetical protein
MPLQDLPKLLRRHKGDLILSCLLSQQPALRSVRHDRVPPRGDDPWSKFDLEVPSGTLGLDRCPADGLDRRQCGNQQRRKTEGKADGWP